MSNNIVTSAEEIQRKIEEKRYSYFTFPVLEITIKYRKPDLLKLSFNKSLPAVMAGQIIDAYKQSANGVDMNAYRDKVLDKKLEADDDLVKDLGQKGYNLLKELCVSHKVLDVPQSDFVNEVIAWVDIPEEDAIAFLLNLINASQTTETQYGGEISEAEITSFPEGEQVPKRDIAGKGRKNVRQVSGV